MPVCRLLQMQGTALVDRYRNERRIELAYEEHRYHDARRWMIPATNCWRELRQLKYTATLKPGKTATGSI